MTVVITMSNVSGGDQVEEVIDMGTVDPEKASGVSDLYVRHDAVNNPITDCGFYIVRYAGDDYDGASDPDLDYTEVLAWGDTTANGHGNQIDSDATQGGLFINQDHSNGFLPATWTVFNSSRGPSNSSPLQLSADAINISPALYTPVAGELPQNGEAHVQTRWDIPDTATTAGSRYIQLVLAYSYTS